MKRFYLSYILLLVLAQGLFAQSSFEGTLEMDAKLAQMGEVPIPATFSMKGDRMKLVTDFGMGETTVYFDKASDRVVAVLAAMNMGFELNPSQVPPREGDIISPAPASNGKRETINTFACDGFTCQFADGLEMEIWATRDMPNGVHRALLNSFSSSIETILKVSTSSFADLVNKGYAPVRTIVRKNGKETAALTISKFENQPLDDAIFTIPTNVPIRKFNAAMMGE